MYIHVLGIWEKRFVWYINICELKLFTLPRLYHLVCTHIYCYIFITLSQLQEKRDNSGAMTQKIRDKQQSTVDKVKVVYPMLIHPQEQVVILWNMKPQRLHSVYKIQISYFSRP